jgi:hypothetical protein
MKEQTAPHSDKNQMPSVGWRRLAAHTPKVGLAIAAVAAATLGNVPSASAQAIEPTIEGAWRVTRHGVNCQTGQVVISFPAIMAFNRDGIVTGYAVPPFATPAMGSPDYGVWKRSAGPGSYSFRLLSMNYEGPGNTFSGTTEVAGDLVMKDANSFEYQSSVQFFDAQGNPFPFTQCGAAQGTRFR